MTIVINALRTSLRKRYGILLVALLAVGGAQAQDAAMPKPPIAKQKSLSPVIVIAHRGASGLRPEHTIAGYTLAIEQGADFIEPDLVLTKDDVFVARHENDITDTTDVAKHAEFADRKTTKVIDGQKHVGWFTEDFTLAELKTLRAKERLPLLRPDNVQYDGQFEVPTLAEVIALAKQHKVGIYPETKHPSYFAGIGHPMEARLVAELKAAGWDSADAPVFIQSFEVDNLKRLKTMTKVKLIQLMDASGGPADKATSSYVSMITPEGLKAVAAYAYGIGPGKAMIADGTLIAAAHVAGLRVHPWTFRAENYFLPARLWSGVNPRAHGRVEEEIRQAIDYGVDGYFTDFPALGVAARAAAAKEQ
jgi:glycerophosphoryl diester phosphodiesterase